MQKEIKFSIIIPAYNSQAYMEDCLKSVMMQKNASFEVVLVNDGSTDATAEICKKWADSYHNIKYIEQENKGQGEARNVAIKHARGEYLVFLDADDALLPGALECLDKISESQYDIVVYGCEFVSQNTEEASIHLPPDTEQKSSKEIKYEVMRKMLSVLWDKMIRKELWEREKIVLSNQYGEDIYPVYMLSAKAGKIGTIRTPLICHYDRPDNLSSKPDKILQIVQSVSDTLNVFRKKEMFQEYETELFLMLEKQHRHYRRLYKINRLEEEREIVERLRKISLQFPERYRKILHIDEEMLIIIGNIRKPLPGGFENYDIRYYECMELYLIDENKIKDKVCHFIVNVENEIKSVNMQTRTEKWALSYWKTQCLELMESRKERGGNLYLYTAQRTDLVRRFEDVCANIHNGIIIDKLSDFFVHQMKYDNAIRQCNNPAGHVNADADVNVIETMAVNYRWEYWRLNENINLLYTWLQLRQCGINLEEYFLNHEYKNIAIYGNGYLGKLLITELRDSRINISFLIDKDSKQETELPLYSPEDEIPEADVIVVSVIHLYGQIKERLQRKRLCRVVSLYEAVDWCRSGQI